jgi:predicted peroxiredoxin
VTPLAIIVSGPDPARLRSALGLAAAQAALGGETTLFFDALAVAALAPDSLDRPGGSLPPLRALLDACLDLGTYVLVCQTGLADAGLTPAALDPRFEYGGLTGLLAAAPTARLVIA